MTTGHILASVGIDRLGEVQVNSISECMDYILVEKGFPFFIKSLKPANQNSRD